MTKALIQTVQDWWVNQPGQPTITKIHLIVGRFTCVEPASLQFAFTAQAQETILANAELVIQDVPLVAYCATCDQDYLPEIGLRYACPNCQRPMDEICSGRELKIDRIEYAIQEPV